MSNQNQRNEANSFNSTKATSNANDHDRTYRTQRVGADPYVLSDRAPSCNDILLPNGQVMNGKTTLQSFDTIASSSPNSAVVPTIHQQDMILPSGELINAKNTTRSYDHDVENQIHLVTMNRNEKNALSNSVMAEIVVDNPLTCQSQMVKMFHVEAYAVSSHVAVVAKLETKRFWCTKRFISSSCMILIGSAIIVTTLYCGFGQCTSPKNSNILLPVTTTSTPTNPSTTIPTDTPTMSPTMIPTAVLSTIATTALTIHPTTPLTNAYNTKESTISEFMNSISLSNRTIRVNGTTAEDLALSWIIHEDPIFINIDDAMWSTLLLSPFNTSSLISSTQIRLRQRFALLSLWFQQPLQTDSNTSVVQQWSNTSGWLQYENECYWYGIKCNYVDMGGFIGGQRIVTEIDFYDNDTNDTLRGGNNITGTIPPSFGLLTSMKHVDLSDNNFYGTIPDSMLKNWVSVESISIENNVITGTIPESIGMITALKNLNVAKNKISGALPGSIGQCIALERFDASDNQLTGPLPDSIGLWTLLEHFNVQTNHLTGTLPTSIGNWTFMENFYLCSNQFYGTIPDVISTWNVLINFNTENNMFTGTLPNSIGDLSTIKSFDISDNMLTGSIPESIGNCTSLSFFSIEDNGFDGTIPESIGMLTSLTTLFLHSNKLTGTLPAIVGQFTSLQYMSAKNNQLSGMIPSSVGNWSDIVSVQLYNNSFTGSVPSILCSFNASNITADCDLVCDCCSVCV